MSETYVRTNQVLFAGNRSAYLEESFQFLAQLCHERTAGEMFWRSASFKMCTIEVLQPYITHKDCDSVHQLRAQLAPVNTDVCGITCCCIGQSELCLLLGRQKCSLFSQTPLDLVHLHQILVYIFDVELLTLNFWTSFTISTQVYQAALEESTSLLEKITKLLTKDDLHVQVLKGVICLVTLAVTKTHLDSSDVKSLCRNPAFVIIRSCVSDWIRNNKVVGGMRFGGGQGMLTDTEIQVSLVESFWESLTFI